MPYINRSWRNRPWYLDYLSRYIDPPEDSPPQTNFAVELAPFPSHFDATGKAEFPVTNRKESKRIQQFVIRPQTVVYATGYTCVQFSTIMLSFSYAICEGRGSMKIDLPQQPEIRLSRRFIRYTQ